VKVKLTTRRIEIDDVLRRTTTEKVDRLARFVSGMDHAEVRFAEERNPRIAANEVCEITISGHGHHVRAKASAVSATAAVDLCIDKLEHQLHKLKGKLDGRHHGGPKAGKHHAIGLGQAAANGSSSADVNGLAAGVAVMNGSAAASNGAAEVEADDNVARIVRTKQFVMEPMTADDAALQMDLLQHDFFLFTNIESGRSAVVYRRDDGHVGLIEAA
jgi:putative sigma-54 modulation protein